MRRRGVAGLVLAGAGLVAGKSAQAASGRGHKLVLHVDQNDADVMNEALWNLLNAIEYYAGKREALMAEVVANGSGYAMLRDTSPVRGRITEIHKQYPKVQFSACQNSRRGAAQREGKTVEQIVELPEATDVAAGVARLMELQELGYSYIKV